MRADEATHMLERGAAALGGLLLQAAQRPQLALSLDHVLDRFETDGANQLVLEVGVAHVKVDLVAGVVDGSPEDVRLQLLEVSPDRVRAPDRHDLYAVGGQVATATPRQRFQRDTVTVALDDHDRPGLHHARDLFMSTRSPFMTTPSLTRRSRWRLPFGMLPSACTTRCQGTRALVVASTMPTSRGASRSIRP